MKLSTAVELAGIFGPETAPLALRVLQVIERDDTRQYEAIELLAAARIESIMDGMLVLARLTTKGLLSHPDIGRYASTVAGTQTARAAQAA